MHTQDECLHRQSRARTPRHPPSQGRQQVQPGQLRQRLRSVQPQARRQDTSTTTTATTRVLLVRRALTTALVLLTAIDGMMIGTLIR